VNSTVLPSGRLSTTSESPTFFAVMPAGALPVAVSMIRTLPPGQDATLVAWDCSGVRATDPSALVISSINAIASVLYVFREIEGCAIARRHATRAQLHHHELPSGDEVNHARPDHRLAAFDGWRRRR